MIIKEIRALEIDKQLIKEKKIFFKNVVIVWHVLSHKQYNMIQKKYHHQNKLFKL